MDADDRLRLDYEHTMELYSGLVDVRFKLVALVPTTSGVAVGLLGSPRSAAELLAVGLLGLIATFGVFVYDLGNSQFRAVVAHRAAELERLLGLVLEDVDPAVLLGERQGSRSRVFGMTATSERGLALVYAVALAGWSYLVGWGALRAWHVGDARLAGGITGAVVGLLVFADVRLRERRSAL